MVHVPSAVARVLALLVLLVGAWSAHAQELVSVRSPVVNLRAAPGTEAEVLWQLKRGYPLLVLERRGDWLRVRDFEGDEGWVAARVTSDARYHVVKARTLNLRSGPGLEWQAVGTARYGDVLATVRRQGDWVQLRSPDGNGTVWAASDHLWGW
ncbi:SH3 domain protein [Tepidimonas thermarum]|uniref:SH3 domain protein n=1 Tax=Tepidimonas thermarum TaxID=335431 RepID=A0A554X2P3_9BURK|nr:SH3 domain-containing protein [Tepidimonas thermarum]TSE30036.1 SH3 domain protein [Tepidimonas thermarum]